MSLKWSDSWSETIEQAVPPKRLCSLNKSLGICLAWGFIALRHSFFSIISGTSQFSAWAELSRTMAEHSVQYKMVTGEQHLLWRLYT